MTKMKSMRIKVSFALLGMLFVWNITAKPANTDDEVAALVRDTIYYEDGIDQAEMNQEAVYAYLPQVTLTD